MLTTYIRFFFNYAGKRAWLSLGLAILLGLTQGIGLVMILPFLHIIGIATSNGTGGYAQWIFALMQKAGVQPSFSSVLCIYLAIISTHAVIVRYREILNAKLVQGFTQYLRNKLYAVFCHADWLCFLKTPDADIIYVLTADLSRVGLATQQVFQLIGSVIIVVIHLIVSMIISIPMTLSAIACGGVFLLVLRPFNRKAARFGTSLRNSMGGMYTAVSEHIGGMKVAKSYNLEKQYKKHFRSVTDDITDQMVRFTKINTATRLSYQVGAAMAICVFLTVGVKIIKMPSLDLIVIVFLFARILPGFSGIQQCAQRIINAMPSFRAVLDMENRFKKAKEPIPPINLTPLTLGSEIKFNNVSFRYDKRVDTFALKDINLVIPANSMTALAGTSGAGKSTVADLILGLLTPDQGRISIDGTILDDSSLHSWRISVGYVPQETFLFHESIRENLLRACPESTESDMWRCLAMAAADKFVSNLPKGIHTVVGDRGVRLSGGERQRIALARALLRKPSLLLLDEATSSLDIENERHIQQALQQLHGKLTIIVIAHRLSTIQGADHVVVIDGGKVIEQGSWQEIQSLKGIGKLTDLETMTRGHHENLSIISKNNHIDAK